jgi:hypothetical protein
MISMSLSRRILFSLMFALLATFSFHSAKALPARPLTGGSGQASLSAAPEKEDDEKGEKEDEDEDDDDKDEKVQP